MAGRKRKNAGALREPICFSVDPSCKQMAGELRKAGFNLGELVELFIAHTWAAHFGGEIEYNPAADGGAVQVVVCKSD